MTDGQILLWMVGIIAALAFLIWMVCVDKEEGKDV